jgi:hypothetical protein
MAGRTNYLVGDDPSRWHSGIPSYSSVTYENVYPGISLVYYGNKQNLEYDFVVAPGADPDAIRFGFENADMVELDGTGELVISNAGARMRLHKPLVYQEAEGGRQQVACIYSLDKAGEITFRVEKYDEGRPLIIDPVLSYSTLLAGNGDDQGLSIAVDVAGNVYITGFTDSHSFPMASPLQPVFSGVGICDCFVTKFDRTGSALIYSTYLGGDLNDQATSIAVDLDGSAYVTGQTFSTNFPTTNAIQASNGGSFGTADAFVAKISPAGDRLMYATYLGGGGGETGRALAVDLDHNAYITGTTNSANFPLSHAIQSRLGGDGSGGSDAFVSKIDSSGTSLVYSTYLGGSNGDGASAIAVDATGGVFLTGAPNSKDFPTIRPLQSTLADNRGPFFQTNGDAFITRIEPEGTSLVYSTYMGGIDTDRGTGIAVDSSGNAYVTGETLSENFPLANALQDSYRSHGDGFVAKLVSDGSSLIYSTYLGGQLSDTPNAISIDSSGNAYLTGYTWSPDFPLANALRDKFRESAGSPAAFIAKVDSSGGRLSYSTFLAGARDYGASITVNSDGDVYVVGSTASSKFPVTSNAFQKKLGRNASIFVLKLGVPKIASVAIAGKNLVIQGTDFDSGAVILMNGEPQKTRQDDRAPDTLIGKKLGKQIAPGQTVYLQIRNPDGETSKQFAFARPVE